MFAFFVHLTGLSSNQFYEDLLLLWGLKEVLEKAKYDKTRFKSGEKWAHFEKMFKREE